MNKNLFLFNLVALIMLSSCAINQSEKSNVTENAPTVPSKVNSLMTFKAPAVSFDAFEIDYDPDIWQERNEEGTIPYLESINYPGCVFHQLLGSGNGPYGEEYHFTIDGREFTYYLNNPNENAAEKSPQSILIYYKDPDQDFSIRWGFQVSSEYETVDQCFDLVKGLLSNLRIE